MKEKKYEAESGSKLSRRKFLTTVGLTTGGLLAAPYLKSANILAYNHKKDASYLAQVGVTQADNYERAYVKAKVQHLFDSIGGISDIVKPGNKVAIKINLTGGSGSAYSKILTDAGKSITETMWTHPEVVRAVGELLIDAGVNGSDIYIVEALWDNASYNNFGYLDVQNGLGAKMINLNNAAPYSNFVTKDVGPNRSNFTSMTYNQILDDVDVYVSIPKMKQHFEAGFTGAIKNQIGATPLSQYTIPGDAGRRGGLHSPTHGDSSSFLPESICDLYFIRPVNLAVIDGIMNARGGEGVWNPTFQVAQDKIMLAGKSAVATDSVAAYFMGNNPEESKFKKPDGNMCDNHLYILNQKGAGTNKLSEIEIVGDGKNLITSSIPDYNVELPSDFVLSQNFPNPFNPATLIRFYVPVSEFVTVKIYNIAGQEIETLVNGTVPAGHHDLNWNAGNLASGVYIYRMQAGKYSDSKKMIYQK